MMKCSSERRRRSVEEISLAEETQEEDQGEENDADSQIDVVYMHSVRHRERRSILNKPVFGYLSGEVVAYKRKVKCTDLQCPAHTTCYEMYPAKCRADPGFIQLSSGATLPFDEERMFQLNGLRFDMQWKESFSDLDSLDFHLLATRM